jgi:hypothetical protein
MRMTDTNLKSEIFAELVSRDGGVAQVSKPAVSPTSKPAGDRLSNAARIWKSATQQTGKSALPSRPLRNPGFFGLWNFPCDEF